jgi:acyl-CoA-dependent ceramide synthase
MGSDDLPFVLLWVVMFTGIRAAIMDYILHPLARAGGIKSQKGAARFAEQAWLLIYCSCFWSLGMYIFYNSNYWLNLPNMWHPWPIREISGLFKWYYLVQFAFWLQQILVVNIEEKRKDFAQMLFHHIVTSILIFMSYGAYQLRVGNVILCLMDVGDIVLAIAKILKYLGYKLLPDIVFGIFVVVWIIARHCLYLMVVWSLYVDAVPCVCSLPDGRDVVASSTAEYASVGGLKVWKNVLQVYLDHNGTVCWNSPIRGAFISLLLMLQVLMILWFVMIMRVIWKVIKGTGADDVRSDDEGEDEEIDDGGLELEAGAGHALMSADVVAAVPDYRAQEQEVGVEGLTFARRTSPGAKSKLRSSAARGGRASGISIPGHRDHKELLGRIGCDKPS